MAELTRKEVGERRMRRFAPETKFEHDLIDTLNAEVAAMRDELIADGHTEGCAFMRSCDCVAEWLRRFEGE